MFLEQPLSGLGDFSERDTQGRNGPSRTCHGGAFQPWTFGFTGRPTSGARGLATLYDSSVDYQLNPHVAVVGYFGYAIGKSGIAAVYPKGKDGRLGYLELGYRF